MKATKRPVELLVADQATVDKLLHLFGRHDRGCDVLIIPLEVLEATGVEVGAETLQELQGRCRGLRLQNSETNRVAVLTDPDVRLLQNLPVDPEPLPWEALEEQVQDRSVVPLASLFPHFDDD